MLNPLDKVYSYFSYDETLTLKMAFSFEKHLKRLHELELL